MLTLFTVLIFVQELLNVENLASSDLACGDLIDDCRSDHPLENPTKDFDGLTDEYWVSFSKSYIFLFSVDICPCFFPRTTQLFDDLILVCMI